MNFVEELRWRGMLHSIMPDTEEQLNKEMTVAYVGIDPTAKSLHIGHLTSVMLLKHFQRAGHKPIALLGGATGMIGDPSGKSKERNLLNEKELRKNESALKEQLSRFLDFHSNQENAAELVNNYDWMSQYSFLEFIRDIGKHISVNYMMAKESVKKRLGYNTAHLDAKTYLNEIKDIADIRAGYLISYFGNNIEDIFNAKIDELTNVLDIGPKRAEDILKAGKNFFTEKTNRQDDISKDGMSFTEFSYQLVQATDFYQLYKTKDCKLQMGGSDQWGNITTGTELIRRKLGGEAYALTCPLITKADGGKFGKTEEGNVWLDPELTSPYKFYQFWLNVSDEDAEKHIRIFTIMSKEDIDDLITRHRQEPHRRLLQNKLAEEVTVMVHSREEYEKAVAASKILFGKSTTEELKSLDEKTFLSVFEGVPVYEVPRGKLEEGVNVMDLLAEETSVFGSKGEVKRLIKGGGLNINKKKVDSMEENIDASYLLNNKYLLVQKGKKNYFIIKSK